MGVNKVQLADGEVLIDLGQDTVTTDTVLEGATFHGPDGTVKTGTFTLASEMTEQDSLIEQIKAALRGKAAGGMLPTQEKAVEITENGVYEVVPDEGYVLSKANITVAVEPSGDSTLPAGYTQVDYIQFKGKQLVDTGIIGNQDTRIRTSFTWDSTTQNHVYGCASPNNTASITSFMNGSWRFGAKTATKSIAKNSSLLPYSACVDKTMIGVTGSNTAISDVEDFETVSTLLLGGARSSDGDLPGSGIVGKVLYFNLWQGDEQVMKLIPVVSDDGVYRFYDMITKSFFDSITGTPLEGGNL